MTPGSVKIFDRVSAVEAIKRLSEDDLLDRDFRAVGAE